MDVRHLRYFIRIVELKSVTRAASELHVAQSALSLHIKNLEQELGVALISRHSRGIEPTRSGALLYDHALRIIGDLDRARADLADFADARRVRIVLGTPPEVQRVLARLLPQRCRAELPQVTVNLIDGPSDILIEQVRTGQIDLCCAHDVGRGRDFRFHQILRDDLVFARRRRGNGRAAAAGAISFAEVARHPLVLPAMPHGLRRQAEEQAAQQGLSLDIAFEVQSLPLIRELVNEGLAATVAPFWVFSRDAGDRRLDIRTVVEPEMPQTLWLFRPHRGQMSEAEMAIEAMVREILADELAAARRRWDH
jgi:LysR family nitrogen assimilation transcriptional regulator